MRDHDDHYPAVHQQLPAASLFVTHNDVRRVKIQKSLQTVVSVDHATIQIIQIRRRKTATIKRYQRTQDLAAEPAGQSGSSILACYRIVKASINFKRLVSFLILVSELVCGISSRRSATSSFRSMSSISSWNASAPILASNSSPNSSRLRSTAHRSASWRFPGSSDPDQSRQ